MNYATVHGSRNAFFSMRDYTWLNPRKFYYGILGSNDEKKFTGWNGTVDQAVLIDVKIEEGEQFINFDKFPSMSYWVWLFIPILVVILTILISLIVYWIWKYWDNKKKAERNKSEEEEENVAEKKMKKMIDDEDDSKDVVLDPKPKTPDQLHPFDEITDFAKTPKR
jgi:uncharacterized membrane protein